MASRDETRKDRTPVRETKETRRRRAGLTESPRRGRGEKQKSGILIVEGETSPAAALRSVLEANGFRTDTASDGRTALGKCRRESFSLALVDARLPDTSGERLVEELARSFPETEYIIVTDYASPGTASDQGNHGRVIAHESKPMDMNRFLSLIREVSEHKQLETELKESEESYRALLELTAEAGEAVVILQDTGGKPAVHRYVNEEWPYITGYSREELLGMSWFELISPDYRAEARKRYRKRERGERIRGFYELVIVSKDGAEVPIEVNGGHTTLQGRQAHVIYIRDISERKRAQQGMEQAAREWRTTFDAIPDMISIHDRDFRITRVNMAFANMVGMRPQEVIGRACYELVHGAGEPLPQCPCRQVFRSGETCREEYLEPKTGRFLEEVCSPIFDTRGNLTAAVHVARDVTERKKLEEQLFHSDRLASIGELASGIAHELNNPLTSIIGFSELLRARDLSEEVRDDLEIIHREARRSAGVVNNLLTFARKHKTDKEPVDIHKILRKVLELRAYQQKVNRIRVVTRLASRLPGVIADEFQLQQVFLNLIINAEHFMIEAHGAGTLTITTGRSGDTVKVSFTDDGPGIPRENLAHVFDPFFTTKESGKGTGLGLSVSHGIITESGGRIHAESEPGRGATFTVELPVSRHRAG